MARKCKHRFRPGCEDLEGRQLLTRWIGPHIDWNFTASQTRHIISELHKDATKDAAQAITDAFGATSVKGVAKTVLALLESAGANKLAGWFQGALNSSHGRGTTLEAGVALVGPLGGIVPEPVIWVKP